MTRKKFACLAAVVALGLPTSAFSSDPGPSEIAVARRLFDEAKTAEEAKDWTIAVSKLREAISIKETAGLRFHLAYCEEQQGMLVEALVDYERADDLSMEKDEELRSQIPARRTSLQKRIPTVTLLFTRDPARSRLTVDGQPRAPTSFGKPIPLNPGKHAFGVVSPGFAAFAIELTLKEGDAVVTNVVLTPDVNADAVSRLSDSPPAAREGGPKGPGTGFPVRTYALVGEAAVTLGALAIGIAYTLEGASEDERAANDRAKLSAASAGSKSDACSPPLASPQISVICADLATAVDGAGRDRFVARLGFIGAGVGVAAFTATLVLFPAKRPQMAIRLMGPLARGLSLEGTF
jgi:hypothetical protein